VLNDEGDFIGFDVIIGNPPWGADLGKDSLEFIKNHNKDIVVRMVDSFMFFINLSFTIKSNKGQVGLIVPDVLLYQADNKLLRHKILTSYQLHTAINLGDNIFLDVARPSCIITISNQIDNITKVAQYKNKVDDINILEFNIVNTNIFVDLPNEMIATRNLLGYKIINKFNELKLNDILDKDSIQRGISPDLKSAFIINDENVILQNDLEKHYIKKTLTGGRDLKKYGTTKTSKSIIYTSKFDDEKKIPNIIKYISKFKKDITCKEVKENKHPFWSLHRTRDESIFKKSEKILGVITGDRIITSIDYNYTYPTDGLYLMSSNSNYSNLYIVGLLNSTLMTYIYRLISMEEGRTLAQVKPTIIKELPVPNLDKQQQQPIIDLVDKILDAKKENPEANTSHWESEIDTLVYKLYNLTEEEIQIVEEG